MFHTCILYCIHKCIEFFFYFRLLYRDLFLFIQHYVSLLASFLPVQRCPKQVWFKKLPSHLGIILCEERISFSDISNLIAWSFCLGIHHVSIYDDTGFIKANGEKLYEEASLRKKLYLKKEYAFNMVFSDGRVPFVYNTIRKNGHTTENTYVYLLSHEDGKQQIVKATKNLCKDAKRKPEILNYFHAQHFEYYLKDVLDIPDPELIFHFGKKLGLIGYLPWHIRLSEILSYPTHHNITIEEFQKLLQRYSKCEQRFGK